MIVEPISTPRVQVNDDLLALLDGTLPRMREKSIVVITSKIVSLCEGQVVASPRVLKRDLIRQEADAWLEGTYQEKFGHFLTITRNILIPSAGIDESNGFGGFILYPKDCFATVTRIWHYLRQRDGVDGIGVLMTDSHTTPLRRGVIGIGLAWCGFNPLKNYIGAPDLDGKPMRVTQSNYLDGLAAAAVCVMGEGAEQTPLALISNVPHVTFTSAPPSREEVQMVQIDPKEDLYAPLLESVAWQYKR